MKINSVFLNAVLRRRGFIIFVLSLAIVSVAFRLLQGSDFARSSAMFVGIPALLAIGLSLVPVPRSATGSILLYTTLVLLTIGVLAIEGLVCILLALPFFLSIGFVIGIFVDRARTKSKEPWKTRCSLAGLFALLSLEGVSEDWSFNRDETVVVSREVAMGTAEFESLLSQGPDFDARPLPAFLTIGFPRPTQATVNREDGTWTVPFDHGKMGLRNLVVKVVERGDGKLVLEPVSDETEIGKWLTWDRIEWRWKSPGPGRTTVTVEFSFRRNLDPAWYFGPVERYGVGKAGGYFVDSVIR